MWVWDCPCSKAQSNDSPRRSPHISNWCRAQVRVPGEGDVRLFLGKSCPHSSFICLISHQDRKRSNRSKKRCISPSHEYQTNVTCLITLLVRMRSVICWLWPWRCDGVIRLKRIVLTWLDPANKGLVPIGYIPYLVKRPKLMWLCNIQNSVGSCPTQENRCVKLGYSSFLSWYTLRSERGMQDRKRPVGRERSCNE